jgi:hypothetical protein
MSESWQRRVKSRLSGKPGLPKLATQTESPTALFEQR